MYNFKVLNEGVYRVFKDEENNNLLTKYGILNTSGEYEDNGDLTLTENKITLNTKRLFELSVEEKKKGYILTIPLADGERLFGGGDCNRDNIMRRGSLLEINIRNVVGYGPMGIVLSTCGWALVLNCTFKTLMDLGNTKDDEIRIETFGGEVDFFLFKANSLKELIQRVTSVTGRPTLMPKFAYGLTLVENEQIDTRGLLWDIKTLRDKGIACDTIGLEPSWMSEYYDYSVNKKWSKERFYLPKWQKENSSGSYTFFYPMRKMGMKLSLWLCEDYDLIYKEENDALKEEEATYGIDAEILDANFVKPRLMDKITKHGEAWFEHLKKFVDNGASAFKLDGANQVIPHPDRLWGGKYLDEEIHNLYPVILAKQMERGFAEYTDRRLLLYSAGAFTGVQQYTATWAGDTGGGPRTAVSLMNYAMCGHSNTSCDIDVSPCGIHYGFLLPWSQYFCWSNWLYPWFLGDETENMVREYSLLRSSLIPYIYTMAHKAYETGLSILRPLSLMYEDKPEYDNVLNAYMLGDSLYVGVFDMSLTLPEGKWVDYFTGEIYQGNIDYTPPEGKGGALFAKQGSIFVTMLPQKYVLEKSHDYVLKVYPGEDCSFDLYEDDGLSFDYREGNYTLTPFRVENSNDDGFELAILPRVGGFSGKPDNGHDIKNNSIPYIPPMEEERDMTVSVFGEVRSVSFEGAEIPFKKDGKYSSFVAPLKGRENKELNFKIEM